MRILLVEDDPTTSRSIEMMLGHANLNVYCADLGEDGIDLAKLYDYDLILLDLNLPDMSGHEVLRQLRLARIETPILILSGADDTDSKLKGFGFGADDYLTKPFAFAELLARLRLLMRRASAGPANAVETALTCEDLDMDLLSRKVKRNGRLLDLQPREFRLLEYLIRHKEQVVTRTMLLEGVWDYHFDPGTNVIDVHVSRLRKKIDAEGESPLIHTVRGAGYRLGARE